VSRIFLLGDVLHPVLYLADEDANLIIEETAVEQCKAELRAIPSIETLIPGDCSLVELTF
ncbi:MAG: hypothetical protein NTZ80_04130, partial [Patescibacteria group bacterium]|nr:hypothetical protein [Patescibacteria group bacterium]